MGQARQNPQQVIRELQGQQQDYRNLCQWTADELVKVLQSLNPVAREVVEAVIEANRGYAK